MNRQNLEKAVQVVKVYEHSYTLDEVALERILLREDVKDLPVVVVSVAGAYRGGKSFLINFFLRYLTSSKSSRNNGTWLGAAGEQLTGFSWRGGSERNTTGIQMVSDPIICTLSSGEKVAVLLMDTQGTFDNQSTVRDCSTIFALSTLLSSVQIYNLSQHIKEDDLQHLQFFTEYGRLIKQENGKAFQVLKFLVRDWPHPFEHPYGADGGQSYLQKIFKVNLKELRELREHVKSSFDTITCFLMPHPGLEVLEPTFNGSVDDISIKFQKSLIEFVDSLFTPANLVPKMINGQRVRACELFTYFKTYMTIFNSDTIPTPVSILKATSEAGMRAAMMEAREQYEVDMERECGHGQPSMPSPALQKLHHNAVAAARATFINKKKMGSKEDADKYLSKLIKELDGYLSKYISLNYAKTQIAIIEAKEAYEESLRCVSEDQSLCLHRDDLLKFHDDTVQAAIQVFDAHRRNPLNEEDDERADFIRSFEKRYEQLTLTNDQNNKIMISEIREKYHTYMERVCHGDPPLSLQEFRQQHEKQFTECLDEFKMRRSRSNSYMSDNYKSELVQNITNHFEQLQAINNSRLETINRVIPKPSLLIYNSPSRRCSSSSSSSSASCTIL